MDARKKVGVFDADTYVKIMGKLKLADKDCINKLHHKDIVDFESLSAVLKAESQEESLALALKNIGFIKNVVQLIKIAHLLPKQDVPTLFDKAGDTQWIFTSDLQTERKENRDNFAPHKFMIKSLFKDEWIDTNLATVEKNYWEILTYLHQFEDVAPDAGLKFIKANRDLPNSNNFLRAILQDNEARPAEMLEFAQAHKDLIYDENLEKIFDILDVDKRKDFLIELEAYRVSLGAEKTEDVMTEAFKM
jgi:hypothetical protein